jgi:hypothetical protein
VELFARELDPQAEWREVDKGHRRLIERADKHYTRQKPGTAQATRPGCNLVLLTSDGSAAWVVWRPIPSVGRLDDLEAWECTLFRNEGVRLSSTLIVEAVEVTHRKWGWPPRDGLITAVGITQTKRRRSKRSPPGKCFLEAGWTLAEGAAFDLKRISNPNQEWLVAPRPHRTERMRG